MSDARYLAFLLATSLSVAPAGACTISATGPAFGQYDTLSLLPADSAGRIVLSCELLVEAPTVALSAGQGSFLARAMVSGASRLDYNLYADFTRASVWGDGTQGSQTVTMTGGVPIGGMRSFSRAIYGRVPARQRVDSGFYSDALLITVTF